MKANERQYDEESIEMVVISDKVFESFKQSEVELNFVNHTRAMFKNLKSCRQYQDDGRVDNR